MLSLELAKIVILCIVDVWNSWSSDIYTFVGVPLLTFLYVKIVVLANSLQGLLLFLIFINWQFMLLSNNLTLEFCRHVDSFLK